MGQFRQRGSKHDIPESAHIIRDYATLQKIAASFAEGKVKLLVVLGGPGKGKSQMIEQAMEDRLPTSIEQFMANFKLSMASILIGPDPDAEPIAPLPRSGPGLFIKGDISPISFHIKVHQHLDQPICIDDADDVFANPRLRERIKHLTETDQHKLQEYSKLSKELIAANVPERFWTSSPVCIIRNIWDSSDSINQAIESRGMFIVFEPTWDEVYQYIGTWFWDQEIYDYLREMLPLLREPDVRIVVRAYETKLADIPGFPWQKVIDNHIAEPAHRLMADFLRRPVVEFGGEEQRIAAWISAVKAVDPNAAASRAKWHRDKKAVEALLVSHRPERVLLARDGPPLQRRPIELSHEEIANP